MRSILHPSLPMQQFLTGIARSLVEAQCVLDKRESEGFLRCENQEVSPNTFVWSQYRLIFPLALQCQVIDQASNETHLVVAPRKVSKGNLKLVFRYLPKSQD